MSILTTSLVQSSLARKYVMALTGFVLIVFVLGHMAGNLLIYAGPNALNDYGHALKANAALLWTARGGLLLAFILHVYLGVQLTAENTAARPVRYVVDRPVASSWASRHMLVTGLVILAFLVFHLAHYTVGLVQVDPNDFRAGDVRAMSIKAYREPWVVATYLAAQVFLFLHLWHGASSWFQSLGLNHPKWNPFFRRFGPAFATLIFLGNASIPLSVVVGIVK